MVDATGRQTITNWRQVLPRHTGQLELPLDGLASARRLRFQANLKEFAFGFAPRLGSKLLMRVGVPMVAATTPVAIGMFAPDKQDEFWWNLGVGTGLGGAWGAAVGGLLPFSGGGERISRFKSMGRGAASGMLMAPAVAIVSKYVVDWITTPIRADDGTIAPRVVDGKPGDAEGAR